MQKDNEPIIEVKNVSKFFGEKTALDHIDLSIRKGEFVTILGPSGCGKTTLLRLIAGFQTASEGEIRIGGKEITQVPPHKRPVNTVFQKYALFPHLNVYDNIAFGLKLKKMPKDVMEKKVKAALKMVGMTDYEYRDVNSLSGGQQQRVAIARAIVNEPEVLLLDEPLAALDLKMRKDMQMELKEMHKRLGITFVYVTHDQEEALTLSDTIVVMSEGKIQQIGTPTDIYNEPVNCFVADFIGESNILNGTMIKDKLVRFCGKEFECVDEGFGENMPVDVVIRPEDFYIFPVSDVAQLVGKVQSCIFKGVHYEMVVLCDDYELTVQDYHGFDAGTEVGLLVKPMDIQIMKKERTCNTFEGKMVGENRVEFLGCEFDCLSENIKGSVAAGDAVEVEVDFEKVNLEDNASADMIEGEVKFILYKGNHYHLTVHSDWDEDVFVDTNDVWDNGDRVGITIPAEAIRVMPVKADGNVN
ncbi:polyamine ABC transporter ATP-binding protein [uncultured Bacteroides sp.]|uniref:polyamine ABC transporter ATP-binding protein n=1 Tax=uncultured Bacteroides sp. TaxID=162156 RepID=UPI002635E2F4|nr:polyamine ABC transporter ATP-binding protein [uncultured Bacteroides sp.]